jgi:hypothetical protein
MPSVQEASAERPDEMDEDRQEEVKPESRENYILVRHMARSPRTRTLRAARAGHRRQGILLRDGKRIRKKGKRRFTQLSFEELVDNHSRLLEFVRVGALEFCDPRSQNPIPYEELVRIVQMIGEDLKGEGFELDLSGQTVIGGAYLANNTAPFPWDDETDGAKSEDEGGDEEDDEEEDEPEGDEPEGGLTEEQMLEMKFDDLKALAIETYGCDEESISKMRSKKEVVSAIFSAAEQAEGEE